MRAPATLGAAIVLGIGLCLGIAAAALAAGCGSRPAAPDQPAPILQPADSCTTADDCDLVDACCGCSAGGKRIAIRKDAVAGFTASHDQRCAGVMCAQMMSTDPSCDAEAICGSRNRCRVAPHMQHQ
jgi:hypothetical protein